MIELTINGKKIATEKGNTILRAALDNGIKIPHLCYDKRLVPYGGCRVCIVEIEGEKKLEASCATLAKEGMVVWTDTPKVRRIRQSVIELMLVHHPLDCPVCDKAGECALQDLVFEYGRPTGRFVRERKHVPSNGNNPLVELTASRCILCGKCVRVCAEHQGSGALGLMGRGFSTTVQHAFGDAQDCEECGQCIDVCPTGAILSKPYKFKARKWTMEEKETICPFCGCGCTLTLGTRDGKIVRARGKEGRGVNEGDLCGRGRFGFDYIYSENRLTEPLVRIRGQLVPVSWDEALQYVSDCLKYVITVHGTSAVGGIGSPRCTNEDNYIFQKFMREVIGSGTIDSSAAFGYGIAEKGWNKAFGLSGHRVDLKSPRGKDVILVLESDPSVTHPLFGINILEAKRDGAKLIVADARETKLTRHSTEWLKIKEGTGVALLNGIMKVIVDRELYSHEHAQKVIGFSKLKKALQGYTPPEVSRMTGISGAEIIAVAEALAEAQTSMITLSLGVSENTKGLDTVLAAANLVNLLDAPPETLQIPAECANTFGLYQMGVRPDAGPIYQPTGDLSGAAGKGLFEMLYETEELGRHDFRGTDMGVLDFLNRLRSFSALYVMGADPVVTFPDSGRVIKMLKSLDLLIVQDIALTETAKLAHAVLPAASWAEKDGTFSNAEGSIQSIVKIVDAPGRALPDWEIVRDLATVMGKDMGLRNEKEILKEYLRKLHRYLHDRDAFHGSAQLTTRAFTPVHFKPDEETDAEYPLRMVVRDMSAHAGSASTRSQSLDLVAPEARLEVSEEDAGRLGIRNNHHVRLISKRGKTCLKAVINDEVPDGSVYVSAHFPHGGVNILTHSPGKSGVPTDVVRVEPV